DHLRYNLLTAQYHLPSLITFAETADHLHRNPQHNPVAKRKRPHKPPPDSTCCARRWNTGGIEPLLLQVPTIAYAQLS
ncbi:hypothetical protein, partial [Cupriavidus sp. SHE]|uniref:hypothetical protein n=1 Tax=Cupriavidus sp. SHE TaxID=1539143 RepID=UPI001E4EF4DE